MRSEAQRRPESGLAHESRVYALTALSLFAQHVGLLELQTRKYNARLIAYVLLMSSYRLTSQARKALQRRPTVWRIGAGSLLLTLGWARTLLACWFLLTLFERYTPSRVLFVSY